MTKEEIMTRCRKVAIKIEGNKIFGDTNSPYEGVPAFRNRELAENNMKSLSSTVTDRASNQLTVCEFYLVPANRIDKN